MPVIDLETLLSSLTNELGLSDLDLRGALGVDARTLDRWRKRECYPQHEARARLDRLAILQAGLREIFTDTLAVRAWMVEDNRYLGHLKPTEVARAGRLDRIEAALEALNSGAFV